MEKVETLKKKIPFDEPLKELNECCNCEGCLCEDLCNEYEDEYFGKAKLSTHCRCGFPLPPKLRTMKTTFLGEKEVFRIEKNICPQCKRENYY